MYAKKILILILVFLLGVGSVAACSGASTAYDGGGQAATTTAATTAAGQWGGDKDSENGSGSASGNVQIVERKIVRNASLSLEVKDVIQAYDQLLAYATARQGYEIRRDQNDSGEYTYLTASIKINPKELDGFIAYAKTIGDLVNCQISTEDITEGYYDTETRLATMEKTLTRYYEFLTQAKNIEESLSVQSQINQLTIEIESLKGKLKLWDSLLAESVIRLELRQIEDPVKIKKEITWRSLTLADMTYLMRSGLTSVANFLFSAAQWLAIVLVVTAPVWVIALVLFLIWRRRRKLKKAAKARQAQTAVPAATVPGSEQAQGTQDKGPEK